jgi:hypothetical protein
MTSVTLPRMAKRTETFSASTLLEVCTKKVGARQGVRVVGFVMRWQAARAEVGRDLTVVEFIAESGLPARTAWRQLREFRQVFDRRQGVTPNEILTLIEEAQAQAAEQSARSLRTATA